MKIRTLLTIVIGIPCSVMADPYPNTQSPEQASYTSPYVYSPAITAPAITTGFNDDPRVFTNWQDWSLTPYSDWQNFNAIQHLDSTWGAYFKPINGPVDVQSATTEWLQTRLVAAASLLRNTVPYGHHHIQVWDVPNTTQWTDAGYEAGYGIDCSDFTHWTYNYGLASNSKPG